MNIYAAIAAGINALWGPLHGGANQMVIEMLEDIQRDGDDIDKYVDDGEGPRRTRSGCPASVTASTRTTTRAPASSRTRATTCSPSSGAATTCSTSRSSSSRSRSKDEYFVERKLYPNVDFYSGLIYRAMGFPTQMFTVLFSIGRLPGWLAHWKEMMESPATKIGRPRQIYVGATKRPYVPIEERG